MRTKFSLLKKNCKYIKLGLNRTTNLPFTIIPNLPEGASVKRQRQFIETGRKRHEGILRHTQELRTSKYSGYLSEADARWKLVHFYDEYDLKHSSGGYELVLKKPIGCSRH